MYYFENRQFTNEQISFLKKNYYKRYGTTQCAVKLRCGYERCRRLARSLGLLDALPKPVKSFVMINPRTPKPFFLQPQPGNPDNRVCSKCHTEKPKLDFPKSQRVCKSCKYNRYQERRRTNPAFKIRCNLASRLYSALKGKPKSTTTMLLVGCDIEFLKGHLESKFKTGMTWENYGTWHIDHIKPCALFDLLKSEEQKKCFHFSNLQPLWAKDNICKGMKYNESTLI